MKHAILRTTLTLLIGLAATKAHAQYSETHDKSGELRTQYLEIAKALESRSDLERMLNAAGSSQVYRIPAMPIVLTSEDQETLRRGSEQRARAMVEFLKDYFSGAKRFIKAGLISEQELEAIAKRQKVDFTVIDANQFNFVYGPDILRTQNGEFLVLEDNPTVVGGVNRSYDNRTKYAKHFPEIKDLAEFAPSFLEELLPVLRARAAGRKVVLLQYRVPKLLSFSSKVRNYLENQQSWDRIAKALDFEIVRINPLQRYGGWDSSEGVFKGIGVNEHGDAMLVKRDRFGKTLSETVIGSVYVDMLNEHLVKWTRSTLLTSWKRGKVYLSQTPGVEMFDDKNLNPYIEKMVEFYLGEKPILRAPRTISAATHGGAMNENLADEIMKAPEKFVIKKVTGEGGSGVHIGLELAKEREKLHNVIAEMRKDPSAYIVQEFVLSSQMGNIIVDYRVHTLIDELIVMASKAPHSRGVDKTVTLKHNVTSNVGSAFQPLVITETNQCHQLFAR